MFYFFWNLCKIVTCNYSDNSYSDQKAEENKKPIVRVLKAGSEIQSAFMLIKINMSLEVHCVEMEQRWSIWVRFWCYCCDNFFVFKFLKFWNLQFQIKIFDLKFKLIESLVIIVKSCSMSKRLHINTKTLVHFTACATLEKRENIS